MTPRRIAVVGAGGTGIPLAVRLAQAGHDVVLIEGGAASAGSAVGGALDAAWTVRAGMPDSPVALVYDAELLPGRAWQIARGRLPGGSTAVNGAYFQRPHPDDFTAWERAGGPEWSYDAGLTALRALEDDRDFGDSPVHGTTGPMPVQRWGGDDLLTSAFLEGATAQGAVLEHDKNGGGPSGAGLLPRNALSAQRWSTARAYGPLLDGVRMRTGATVRQILFEADAVSGLVLDDGEVLRVDEAILCGGAIETPRLLLRSGIGDPELLSGTVHAALPGVGRGLSDHPALSLSWTPRPGIAPSSVTAAWSAAWNSPSGERSAGAFEILFAVASTAAIVTGQAGAPGPIDLRVTLAAPVSRGRVSAPGEGPDIRYGYLSDEADRATLRAAVRAGADLLREGPLAALVADADLPEWTTRGHTDAEADDWLRTQVGTALHSCGTARMGPASDPGAVVDAHGRVHGVRGLRVADASILPVVPTRGTALTAVFLGERIAELIADE